VVNTLGHVTSAVARSLTIFDLGYTGSINANDYVHPDSGIVAGTYNSLDINSAGHAVGGRLNTTIAEFGIVDAVSFDDLSSMATYDWKLKTSLGVETVTP
jgi:hypothetical protein